jgi:DNA polymerase III subunit epsilon
VSNQLAVIDFETANNRPNSACQIGVVLLDDWTIVGEHEWLIRPQRMYFSPQCIRVHGITARDCMSSPTWETVWTELFPLMDGRVVVAHNVGFDAAVLQATSQSYEIALPTLDIQCTRLIAKRAWPGQTGYGLASIAERLGIEFRHHNALEDARACAKIAIAAAAKCKATDLDSLEEILGLIRGRMGIDQIRQPRTVRQTKREQVSEPEPRYQQRLFRLDGTPSATKSEQVRRTRLRADAILAGCEDSRPLSGKYVVLVHTLLGLEREDAVVFLSQLGAVVQSKINMQTHYVIVGTESVAVAGTESEPLTSTWMKDKVAERNEDGQPVRILSQRQLLAMIPSALMIARGELS